VEEPFELRQRLTSMEEGWEGERVSEKPYVTEEDIAGLAFLSQIGYPNRESPLLS